MYIPLYTDGKTAICSGLPAFMSAAKEAYSTLTDSERDALRPSTSQPSAMTRKGIIREGVKAFQKIEGSEQRTSVI